MNLERGAVFCEYSRLSMTLEKAEAKERADIRAQQGFDGVGDSQEKRSAERFPFAGGWLKFIRKHKLSKARRKRPKMS